MLTRSRGQPNLTIDWEINRTLRNLKRQANLEANMSRRHHHEDDEEHGSEHGELRMTLRQYSIPPVDGMPLSINLPNVGTDSFELRSGLIQMVQQNKFGGGAAEDPNQHLNSFMHLCSTFRHNGVSDDAVRLRLFPFSLRDKAHTWLYSLPPGCINTWEDLVRKFLARYFPPMKMVKLRNQISAFQYMDGESLYESWERFKELIRRCPHHGIAPWSIVLTFYSAMPPTIKMHIDSSAGGSLMDKEPDEAHDFIELLANNDYGWIERDKGVTKKQAGIYELESFNALSAQISLLSKKLDSLQANKQGKVGGKASVYQVDKEVATLADYANGSVHEDEEEPLEQANYVNYGGNNAYGNQGRPYYGNQAYYRGPPLGYQN